MRISQKHLFAAYHAFAVEPELPWAERFRHFNDQFQDRPLLQFSSAKIYRRDAEKAYRRLMEPTYT